MNGAGGPWAGSRSSGRWRPGLTDPSGQAGLGGRGQARRNEYGVPGIFMSMVSPEFSDFLLAVGAVIDLRALAIR